MLSGNFSRRHMVILLALLLVGGAAGTFMHLRERGDDAGWIRVDDQIEALLPSKEPEAGSVREEQKNSSGSDSSPAQHKTDQNQSQAAKTESGPGQDSANQHQLEDGTSTPANQPSLDPDDRGDASSASGQNGTGGTGFPPDLIDLNTAGTEQLTELPGIGPSKARAILEYRANNGGAFKHKAELMNVKGIGPKTYEKLKDRITVSTRQ